MQLSIGKHAFLCLLGISMIAPAILPAQSTLSGKELTERVLESKSAGSRTGDIKPIYISGQVALSDGSVPEKKIAIERVCTRNVYQEGYVDAKGHFNIQLGNAGATAVDASFDNPARFGDGTRVGNSTTAESGSAQDSLLWGCNIRAALPGYRSNVIPLEGKRLTTDPNLGTIVLTRMEKTEGYTISVTLAQAPKDAKKAYDKGIDLEHRDKLADARKEFLHAVELYPKHAAAMYELGRIYEHDGQVPQAREVYLKAIDVDPDYATPYERMYALAIKENKWQDAANYSDKLLRLDPYEFGSAWYFNSLAHLQLKDFDIAEKSAREAVKQTGKDAAAKAPYMLALVLANKGQFQEAAENFRVYLKNAPPGADRDRTEKMLADVEQRLQASGTPK